MSYLNYSRKTITVSTSDSIENEYANGFVFTRVGKGIMDEVRSLRLNLENFELNSENRRVARKTDWFYLKHNNLPLSEKTYNFRIHSIGKRFYTTKSGDKTFSASKIKQLVLSEDSNFNTLLEYRDLKHNHIVGYCIAYETENILHYAYPFYDLEIEESNIGMGMIIKALEYAVKKKKKYFYLGSVHEPKSLYKLQFNNIEWWDKNSWNSDLEKLKTEVQ